MHPSTIEPSLLRQAARWVKRTGLTLRRDMSTGEQVKWANTALNGREFWHGRTRLVSYPRVVQVGTNWTCNLKCNFCRLTLAETQAALKARPKSEMEISPHVLEQVLELLPYPECITLTPLGEPLLYSKFGRILERHREVGSRNLAMTTNANLINDDRARMLVEGGMNTLFISIDSSDPEVYGGMRVLGHLDKVEAALEALNRWKEKLRSSTPELILCSTFMERNVRQMPDLLEFGVRHKFQEYRIQLMETENLELESEYLGHHPTIAREMLLRTLRNAQDKPIRVMVNIALRNMLTHVLSLPEWNEVTAYTEGGELPTPETAATEAAEPGDNSNDLNRLSTRGRHLLEKCSYPWFLLLIDTDGDSRPCCWAGSSYGNLNDHTLDELWNGPAITQLRRDFLNNHLPTGCQGKHCRVDLDHTGTLG